MKITVLTVILVLALATVLIGQDTSRCPEKVTYDKFEDTTTEVCATFFSRKEHLKMFSVGSIIQYRGEKPQSPFRISLTLLSGIGKYPGYPKPEFGDVKSIFILADTGRAELAITDYNQSGSDIEDGRFIVETAKFPLTQEAVDFLLIAKTVEARIATDEFKFDAQALKQFQDYAKAILPQATAPTSPKSPKSPTPSRRKRPVVRAKIRTEE